MKPRVGGILFSTLLGAIQTIVVLAKIFHDFPSTWLMVLSPTLAALTYFVTAFIAFLMWEVMFGESDPPEGRL